MNITIDNKYAEPTRILCDLITGGEVIQSDWRASLRDSRRVTVRALEGKIDVRTSGSLEVSYGPLGLIRDNDFWLLPEAVPMLWDLLEDGYCKCGPVGIRAKDSRPSLVVDDQKTHARIRCIDTVLEIDYPGWIDPDINEVRVFADRIEIDKSGTDIHVTFQ